MAIPFSPRAMLCTLVVVGGFAAALTAHLPGGLFGLIGMERDGLLRLETGGAAPRPDAKSEIVHAVLAHVAERQSKPLCVGLSDTGEALANDRRWITSAEREIADADPAERARLVTGLGHLRSPQRAWFRPAFPGEDRAVPLGEENARVLQAAETALLAIPTSGRVDISLDMGALPEVLRGRPPGCDGLLFTAPAVVGNIAFVETTYTCGDLCANGQIYALSWSGGRWQVEAMAGTWIS